MSNTQPLAWLYLPQFGYYRYDARTEQILLLDGRSIPRPQTVAPEVLRRGRQQTQSTGNPDTRALVGSTAHAASRPTAGSASVGTASLQYQPQPNPGGNVQHPVWPRTHPASSASPPTANSTSMSTSPHTASSAQRASTNPGTVIQHALHLDKDRDKVPAHQIPRPQIPVEGLNDESQRIMTTRDPNNDVQMIRYIGPAHSLPMDPLLFKYNHPAHQVVVGTASDEEKNFPQFRKPSRPTQFFTVGKVFFVLWVEPNGESEVTYLQPGWKRGQLQELVYAKMRRFVVIREGTQCCSAIPITTYRGQGVSKPGVKKCEHAIIYTGKNAPACRPEEMPRRGERPMLSRSIRVDPDHSEYKLDPMSRVDFDKVSTLKHNLKVKSFGKVNRASMDSLVQQAEAVWKKETDGHVQPTPEQKPKTR